jgi:hypothetical protein
MDETHIYTRIHRITGISIAFTAMLATALIGSPASATTKGLNQIVTPDIQPEGQLSVSLQQQDPNIGNPNEEQLELGITKNFEVAVFQGTSPGEQIANAELGLVAKGPYLLSTGFLNWSTRGVAPQPYLEAGYYPKATELMAGIVDTTAQSQTTGGGFRTQRQADAILGAAYRIDPKVLLQLDFEGGSGNFVTAGFTYSITPSLNLNPAIYLSNSTPYKGYGYVVLTWNVQLFK